MKKKLIAILLVVVSMLCTFSLSGCSSCLEFLFTFGRRPPTAKEIRESVYDNWGIELPEDIALNYFAQNLGPRGDGCEYYEFTCNSLNENLTALLSSEKTEEFEYRFKRTANTSLKDDAYKNVPEDFALPDFSQDYYWLMRIEYIQIDEDELINESFCILYISNENKLCITEYKL